MAVVAVSTAAIWVRLAMEAAGNFSIGFSLFLAASRLLISSAILLPNVGKLKSQTVGISALKLSAIAGICLAGHFACWISSLALTSVVASTTLVTTNPIWVALLSRIFLKEKLSQSTLWGIAIAVTGGILIAAGSSTTASNAANPLVGNLLALAGAVFASLYMLAGREAQKKLNTTSYITIAYSVAAIALLPLPWIWQTSYRGYETSVYLYIVAMAIVSQLIGHTSFNWSLRWLSPTVVALVILIEPVISGVLAALVFKEIPSVALLWGGIVLLSGIAIAVQKKSH